jgi:hypothetical protein
MLSHNQSHTPSDSCSSGFGLPALFRFRYFCHSGVPVGQTGLPAIRRNAFTLLSHTPSVHLVNMNNRLALMACEAGLPSDGLFEGITVLLSNEFSSRGINFRKKNSVTCECSYTTHRTPRSTVVLRASGFRLPALFRIRYFCHSGMLSHNQSHTPSDRVMIDQADFHLMLQPTALVCSTGTSFPSISASKASLMNFLEAFSGSFGLLSIAPIYFTMYSLPSF